jgi:radical SAM enzyme (TIGR01210 family)
MNEDPDISINDNWIVSMRGNKNPVDPHLPYGWLVEKERTISGKIENTGIIFLTNRECPFHCLMCDLWKNTTDVPVAPGMIPCQIEWALQHMKGIRHIKLYNSGSFFDGRAIPEEDYKSIANLLRELETVIVESHPRFINEKCIEFSGLLAPELHVAIGLETVNPVVLQKLNKKMTLDDFSNAVNYLNQHSIPSRAFILLRPPLLSEAEGIFWAERSIDFAFNSGVECCTVIPVRAGNGAMELLLEKGVFTPPDIHSLEKVLEYGIGLNRGRVFADVWDLELISNCKICTGSRIDRLIEMNLTQKVSGRFECTCDSRV